MKRFLLFFVLCSLLVISCSHDDDDVTVTPENPVPVTPNPVKNENNGVLTVKIDGVLTTFNTVIVDEVPDEKDTWLYITAIQDNSPNKIIRFEIKKGFVGKCSPFIAYVKDQEIYSEVGLSYMDLVMGVNNNNKLRGTFTALAVRMNNGKQEKVKLTEGSFDINYGYEKPNPVINANVLTAKVDGVFTTFDKVTAKEVHYENQGKEGVYLEVTANQLSNPSRMIHFELIGKNEVGFTSLYFTYKDANTLYGTTVSSINLITLVNNNNKLIGVFSAEARIWDYKTNQCTKKAEFTDGYFQIAY